MTGASRRKAAAALRFLGYAAMCIPFLLMAIHRRPERFDLIIDAQAMALGTSCLCVSLRLRGYRRDARHMGILGIVAVLCIVYAWGMS